MDHWCARNTDSGIKWALSVLGSVSTFFVTLKDTIKITDCYGLLLQVVDVETYPEFIQVSKSIRIGLRISSFQRKLAITGINETFKLQTSFKKITL